MPRLNELVLYGFNEEWEPLLIYQVGLDFEVFSTLSGRLVIRIGDGEGWAELQLHPDLAGVSWVLHGGLVVEKFDRDEVDETPDWSNLGIPKDARHLKLIFLFYAEVRAVATKLLCLLLHDKQATLVECEEPICIWLVGLFLWFFVLPKEVWEEPNLL